MSKGEIPYEKTHRVCLFLSVKGAEDLSLRSKPILSPGLPPEASPARDRICRFSAEGANFLHRGNFPALAHPRVYARGPGRDQERASLAGGACYARSIVAMLHSAMEDSVKRERLFYDVLSGGMIYRSLKSSLIPRFPRLKRTLTSEDLSKMRRGGRPRIYSSNAERQRAWYARQKARKEYYKSVLDLR